MDESMMLYLSQEVLPLIQVGAAFVVALLVVMAICIAAINVFS